MRRSISSATPRAPGDFIHGPEGMYTIYTTAFDEEVRAEDLADPPELTRLRAMLDRQIAGYQTLITKLANRLQRKLMARQRRTWQFDLEEGILDAARLARVIANPTVPLTFKQEKEMPFKDTVVTILIDNSGSMRGRPIAIAAMSADIIAQTLERCGLTGVGAPGVINPLVAEQSVLRPSLMPGLVDTLAANARTRSLGLSIYEIGNVFPGREVVADPLDADTVLAGERSDLAVALAGAAAPQAVQLLGVLLDTLGFGAPELDQSDDSLPGGLHPTRSAIVAVEGVPVGEVGEIDPGVLRASEVSERVAWLRLDLDVLLALPHPPAAAQPVSRYPAAVMDLAFVVDEAVPAAALRRALTEAGGDLLERLSLFDEFRGDSIGEHHKSLAWSVTLRAADRTLSDDEVTATRAALVAAGESLGAALRS